MALILLVLVIGNAFLTGWLLHSVQVLKRTVTHVANVQYDNLSHGLATDADVE